GLWQRPLRRGESPRQADQRAANKDRRLGRGDRPAGFGTGFFRECLAADQGDSPVERRQWREHIYAEIRSRARTQGGRTIQKMCELAGVSRASFYRSWERQEPTAAEMAVRDAMQRAALKHRYYGYRRIAAHLQRDGFMVSAKKVRRLMREDNLVAIRRR